LGRTKRAIWWWMALLVTLGAAAYQRLTGPTYPVRGRVALGQERLAFKLPRTHAGAGDQVIGLAPVPEGVSGTLFYRRYKTADSWTAITMGREGETLAGSLPYQPPGGKLAYWISLRTAANEPSDVANGPGPMPDPSSGLASDQAADLADEVPGGVSSRTMDPVANQAASGAVSIPPRPPVVIRFRGAVPGAALIPHIIFMFAGMLWSNRAGMEAMRRHGAPRSYILPSLGMLLAGGLVLGPVVQWYSFGEAWTGFPVGHDLTDNKTLIAVLAWAGAALFGRRAPRAWAGAAALVTFLVFIIPHSTLGTELDYSTLPDATSGPRAP